MMKLVIPLFLFFFALFCIVGVTALDNVNYGADCHDLNTPHCHVSFKLSHPTNIVGFNTNNFQWEMNDLVNAQLRNLQQQQKNVTKELIERQLIAAHAASFEEIVTLPFDFNKWGITVFSSHSNTTYNDNCQIISNLQQQGLTKLKLHGLFYHYQKNTITIDDLAHNMMQTYPQISHTVECVFDMSGVQDHVGVLKEMTSFILPTTVREFDFEKLVNHAQYQIISSNANLTVFPAMLYNPGIYAQRAYENAATFGVNDMGLTFAPNLTLTPYCYSPINNITTATTPSSPDGQDGNSNQYDASYCAGALVNLPQSLFPLTIVTTHKLDLIAMGSIFNTPQCPMIITAAAITSQSTATTNTNVFDVNVNNGLKIPSAVVNAYTISLIPNQQGIIVPDNGQEDQLLNCNGFVLQKAGFSSFYIVKSTTPKLASDVVLPPGTSSIGQYYAVLYQNYQIQKKFIDVKFLPDSFDQTDSRATIAFLIDGFASTTITNGSGDDEEVRTAVINAMLDGFGVNFNYLNGNVYFSTNTPKRQQILTVAEQHHKVSWLSMVSPNLEHTRPAECIKNRLYNEWKLDWHLPTPQNNYNPPVVLCLTLRKSFQSGDEAPGNDKVPIGAQGNAGIKSQLFKMTFFGRFFQQRNMVIQFTSNYSTPITSQNYHNLPLNPHPEYPEDILQLPLPVYTMPVTVIWDKSTCQNPKSQFCWASFRSKFIGGPLTISMSKASIFTQRMAIDHVFCNSKNMGLNANTQLLTFPDDTVMTTQDLTDVTKNHDFYRYSAVRSSWAYTGSGASSSALFTQGAQSQINPYIVELKDPYTNIDYDFHECHVRFAIPFAGNTATVHYQAHTDAQIPSVALMPTNVVKPEVWRDAQLRIKESLAYGQDLSTMVIQFPTSLRAFHGVDLDAVEAQGVWEVSKLPVRYNWTDGAFGVENVKNFLVIETIFETSVIQRPNQYAYGNTLNYLSHFPLFVAELRDVYLDTNTGDYAFTVDYMPLITRFNDILLNITTNPGCIDPLNTGCILNITFPSQNWRSANGYSSNGLRSFSLYIDGVDAVQVASAGRWALLFPPKAENGLHQQAVTAYPRLVSWNDLKKNWNIEAIIPEQMPIDYLTQFYLTPPQFDKDLAQYVVFEFIVDPAFIDNSSAPIYWDPSLPLHMQLSFRKKVQYLFENEYLDVHPYILSYGQGFTENSQYHMLAQPEHWVDWNMTSIFQPPYPIQFDVNCDDPYSPECRIFFYRHEDNVQDDVIFYTIDLPYLFTEVGGTPFYHPTVNNSKTPIYRLEVTEDDGIIIPIVFNIRPMDRTASGANIGTVEFDIEDINNPSLVTTTRRFQYYGAFPYTEPPKPVISSDCGALEDEYCTLKYHLSRAIYKPTKAIDNKNNNNNDDVYIIAQHNITNFRYIFISDTVLLLDGTEKTADDYIYTVIPTFWLEIDGHRDHPLVNELTTKVLVTITGSKHPDHADDPLILTVSIKNDGIPPSTAHADVTALLFGADHYESSIDFFVQFEKTTNSLPIQMLIPPTIYTGVQLRDPIHPVKGLPSIVLNGLGYRPITFSAADNCQLGRSSREQFQCTLTMRIAASPVHPLRDLSRLTPQSSAPHPALPPITLYFHSIPLDIQITSNTPHHIRQQYSQWECAELIQFRLDISLQDVWNEIQSADILSQDLKNNRLTRWAHIIQIYPAFQTSANRCYLTLTHSQDLEDWWGLLVGEQAKYKTRDHLQALPVHEVRMWVNRDILLPTNIISSTFWSGGRYVANEELLKSSAIWPTTHNIPIKQGEEHLTLLQRFKLQWLKEIEIELTSNLRLVNGFPRLPANVPAFNIPGMIIGPAVQLYHISSPDVPQEYLINIKNYALPERITPPPVKYKDIDGWNKFGWLNSDERPTVRYQLYEYYFQDVVDMTIQTDLGYDNEFFPCITTPRDAITGEQTDYYLTVDYYLILREIISNMNNILNVTHPNNGMVYTERLEFNLFNDNIDKFIPIWLQNDVDFLNVINKFEIMGLFQFNQYQQYTQFFINYKKYITSQLTKHIVGTNDIVENAILDKLMTEYQQQPLKPNLKSKACYFFVPITIRSPTHYRDVAHNVRVSFPANSTADGEVQTFVGTQRLTFATHSITAQLHQLDEDGIARHIARSSGINHYNIKNNLIVMIIISNIFIYNIIMNLF